VVGSARLATIANDLEATNHLAHSEEAKNLGSDDATGNELIAVDVASLLYYRGGLLSAFGRGLKKGLGVLDSL